MISAPGPVLAHTDAFATIALVRRVPERQEVVRQHLEVIAAIGGERDLWMPTFNYDFLSNGSFDVIGDPSQVGVINEAFRAKASWRTAVPVFNFCGIGAKPVPDPEDQSVVDPFGEASAFGELVRRDGSILWYGAPISSSTFLHYVESVAGGVPYRYYKFFPGDVTTGGKARQVTLQYHVRPLSCTVNYDWPKLSRDAMNEGVIRHAMNGTTSPVFAARARDLSEHWANRLLRDPFYLLDSESRKWIEPKIESLGRGFEINDFEEVHS